MELPNNMASLTETIAKLPQQKIAQALIMIILAYIAYLGAQITWMLVPDPATSNTSMTSPSVNNNTGSGKSVSVSAVQQLNLFGLYNETEQEQITQVEDAPETRLNLTLTGVVASDNNKNSAAIIEHQSTQETYGIGDIITGTRATLEQVHNDRVLIKQSGRMETLMLDGFNYEKGTNSRSNVFKATDVSKNKSSNKRKKAKVSSRSAKVVDRRGDPRLSRSVTNLRNDLSDNPGKITDYLKISPKRKNGRIRGYALMPGKDPEFFQQSGLKSGDVAIQMNGYDLTVPSDAAQALQALKQEREVALLIDRNGEMTEILFRIDN